MGVGKEMLRPKKTSLLWEEYRVIDKDISAVDGN